MKIIVYHDYYGCDTGCCGHTVEIQEDDGKYVKSEFHFDHPYYDGKEIYLEFAKKLVEESFGKDHVKDLVWEKCIIVDD